ncbi:uncharacterized protein LOC124128128 [Haliotis rufescens]|uniref:uncharacterized protein LOC124128128 n=1 Tax=Haliotis rufescens TaxID=6454 RepID=UPI001EAFFFD8|nr:uncharacterized protein LOC124128128 [Haliotis rufescens]
MTTSTTTPTTTISPCGYPPALLNGEIVRITSSTAEYGCLAGFVMSGPKTIICSGTNWATDLPSCAVIDQSPEVYVFADWWQYFLAALLSFIALLLLAFLIWCCCCNSAKVFPVGSSSGGCCSSCRKSGGRSTAHDDIHDSQRYYHSRTGLIDMEDGIYLVPMRQTSSKKPPSNGHAPVHPDSPHPTPRSDGQIRFMQVVQEVVDEDKNRKKAKPINQWMPHSHPVRNINTSTK